jgi:hypothetical protein
MRTPDTAEKYEAALRKISVDPLPIEIKKLANAENHGFEIGFSDAPLHR